MPWLPARAAAVLYAWYPGAEGGNAVADVLFGDANPGGRLPVTIYRSSADLPPFASYDMRGRTYRYFEGEPLYGFGYGLSYIWTSITTADLSNLYKVLWTFHVGAFFVFLIVLPTTKLRHMLTSPANMYLRDRDRPKGAMKALPNLTETALESFGAARIEDFTWKQLMDTDSCTICGRCTSVCPARNTGK